MKRKTLEMNPTPMRTTNNRIVMRSTCPVSGTTKIRFISRKEIKGAGLGTNITSITLIGPLRKGIFGSGVRKELRLRGTVGRGKTAISDWTRQGGGVDMQSFSTYNDKIKYLLNIINVFSKYAWFIPLLDKTSKNIVRAFETMLKRKPGRLLVDRGGKIYNRTMDH